MRSKPSIKVPHDRLDRETLRNVIEEFVTRDGTELTDVADKIEQVRMLLVRGEVELWYDQDTGSCNIVAR